MENNHDETIARSIPHFPCFITRKVWQFRRGALQSIVLLVLLLIPLISTTISEALTLNSACTSHLVSSALLERQHIRSPLTTPKAFTIQHPSRLPRIAQSHDLRLETVADPLENDSFKVASLPSTSFALETMTPISSPLSSSSSL